jgi:ketosteroid isomerase-like protein
VAVRPSPRPMPSTPEDRDVALIHRAYAAFNARDIDAALDAMHPDVEWPNGMEGGVVIGHAGVRSYWERQWDRIDPSVTPVTITSRPDGRLDVHVHQVVRSLLGEKLLDQRVHHLYTIEDGRVRRMEIEPA